MVHPCGGEQGALKSMSIATGEDPWFATNTAAPLPIRTHIIACEVTTSTLMAGLWPPGNSQGRAWQWFVPRLP